VNRYTYPHVIENGSGERIAFLRRIPTADGDRIEGENVVRPGAGPPMHVHFLQEEGFTVLESRIAYQRPGEPPRHADPGEVVVFAPGEPHRFWNAGDGALRVSGYMQPVGNAEYLLAELFASTKRNGGSRPSPFDAAFLLTRYGSEFALTDVPAVVQRFIFPSIVLLGRLLGKYDRYADAPEPVHHGPSAARSTPVK
jgi:quercetin dioxygenase-like cupin family protein